MATLLFALISRRTMDLFSQIMAFKQLLTTYSLKWIIARIIVAGKYLKLIIS